jgi:branched-chain amino acid transport system ATP-binding protein
MNPQLEVKDLVKSFGGVVANDHIDLYVNAGEIVGLIGPNGAGKSTLFNCIAGFFPSTAGKIIFEGQEIQGKPSYEICELGIARTFQIPKIFADMTVFENVMVGALKHTGKINTAAEMVNGILDSAGLAPKSNLKASALTIADKKRLELSRALATRPKFIMLDEVMAGLTPMEQEEAIVLVRAINQQGVTIFLVEHVMEVVMPISNRVIVLDQGKKIAEDVPEKIVHDSRVIEAYLGEPTHVED